MDDIRNPRLVGGHPALDLVNSVAPRGVPAEQDWLGTPAELLAWAQRAEVIDAAEAATVQRAWSQRPTSADDTLRAVIEVREATYTVLADHAPHAEPDNDRATGAGTSARDAGRAAGGSHAGKPARDAGRPENVTRALDQLAVRWAAATARTRLLPVTAAGPGDGVVRLALGSVPGMLIADRLTHATVDLLRTMDLTALRQCPVEEGGCGWLFLDHSRNGSRRWCSMLDCGAQAKSRRLTARRREHRTATS